MIDLGKKWESPEVAPSSPEKNKVHYPDLYINDIDLGLSEDDAGKEFTATVKVKVRSISSNVNSDSKKNNSLTLEVKAIDFGKSEGKKKDGREHPLQSAIEEGLEAEEAKKKDK
jgi:hypothetical protein